MSEPTAATEGTTFRLNGDEFVVGPKCEANGGRWVCTTHGETFQHNWAKDTHVESRSGEHVLAWVCFEHGPEVP